MIAADTSTWIAFFEGATGRDVELLDDASRHGQIVMVPAVMTELLSDPQMAPATRRVLSQIPFVEIEAGYWERSGALRATVISKKRKTRLSDALIAQSCLDREILLITRDRDFRAFAAAADRPFLAV